MIENMVLTSYLGKSYFVVSSGGYVASIQVMSRDKLKHQVDDNFCRATNVSCQATQLSCRIGGYVIP